MTKLRAPLTVEHVLSQVINKLEENEVEKVVNYIKQQATFDYKKEISLSEEELSISNSDDLISNNNVDYKTEFRELYLSFFPSFGELKFGKQLHSWGSVDINSPLDILNPTDYYYLFTDSDETKIGRESIVLDLYIKSLKILKKHSAFHRIRKPRQIN